MYCAWKIPVADHGVILDAELCVQVREADIPQTLWPHLAGVWLMGELTGESLIIQTGLSDDLLLVPHSGQADDGWQPVRARLSDPTRFVVPSGWRATRSGFRIGLEFRAPVYATPPSYPGITAEQVQEICAYARTSDPGVYLSHRISARSLIPPGFVQADIGFDFVRLYYAPARAGGVLKRMTNYGQKINRLTRLSHVVPDLVKELYASFDVENALHTLYRPDSTYACLPADRGNLRVHTLGTVLPEFEYLARKLGRTKQFQRILKTWLHKRLPEMIPEICQNQLTGKYVLAAYRKYYPARHKREIALLTNAEASDDWQ